MLEPRILFFGLIRPDKGLDVLIEALPAIARQVPEVTLDVVGSPRMPIETLRERARSLGVADRITWDLRFVPEPEVAGVVGRARAVALPYRWIEGSGVFATALAQGVPPVATAVGTFPELCAEYARRTRQSRAARPRPRADADRRRRPGTGERRNGPRTGRADMGANRPHDARPLRARTRKSLSHREGRRGGTHPVAP